MTKRTSHRYFDSSDIYFRFLKAERQCIIVLAANMFKEEELQLMLFSPLAHKGTVISRHLKWRWHWHFVRHLPTRAVGDGMPRNTLPRTLVTDKINSHLLIYHICKYIYFDTLKLNLCINISWFKNMYINKRFKDWYTIMT